MGLRPAVKGLTSRWLAAAGLAAVVLGLGLRIFRLASQPMWYDELIAVDLATLPGGLRGVWEAIVASGYPHPPLYIALLHLVFRPLSPSELTARLPSILASLAGFLALYLLLARTISRRAALAGLAMLGISPYAVYYAQEARPYALMFLLTALSLWLLWEALSHERATWWVAYGVCGLALVYLHYFDWCIVAGEGLYVVYLSLRRGHWQRQLLPFVLSLLGLPLAVPTLLHLVRASRDLGQVVVLDVTPVAISFGSTWMTLVSGESRYVPQTARLVGLVAFAVLALLGAVDLARRKPDVLLLALAAMAVPFAFVFLGLPALGHVVPPYEERQFIVSLPPMLLLAAAGWDRLLGLIGSVRGKTIYIGLAAALALALTAANAVALQRYYFSGFLKNLDVLPVGYLNARAGAQDVVVANSHSIALSLKYHGNHVADYVAKPRQTEGGWQFSRALSIIDFDPGQWTVALPEVLAHRHVWLVSQKGYGDPLLREYLLLRAQPAETTEFGPFSVESFAGPP